jgi:hypothetical protein
MHIIRTRWPHAMCAEMYWYIAAVHLHDALPCATIHQHARYTHPEGRGTQYLNQHASACENTCRPSPVQPEGVRPTPHQPTGTRLTTNQHGNS